MIVVIHTIKIDETISSHKRSCATDSNFEFVRMTEQRTRPALDARLKRFVHTYFVLCLCLNLRTNKDERIPNWLRHQLFCVMNECWNYQVQSIFISIHNTTISLLLFKLVCNNWQKCIVRIENIDWDLWHLNNVCCN